MIRLAGRAAAMAKAAWAWRPPLRAWGRVVKGRASLADCTDDEEAPRSGSPNAPVEPDETSVRLEQEVAAERVRTEALLGTIKELEFKLEVLEKSYSRQLADTRAEVDAARAELSELKARFAETNDELKRVTAVRDRLSDMFAFDGRRIPAHLRERQSDGDDTIGRLLSIERPPDTAADDDRPSPQSVRSQPEPEDLLAPELVFNKDDEKDDD